MAHRVWTDGYVPPASTFQADLQDQTWNRVTSSTRPAAPSDDMIIFETDTGWVMQYDTGSATWKYVLRPDGFSTAATTLWPGGTPALSNITVGNGTVTGSYTRVGRLTVARVSLTFGSTTSVSGEPGFYLPFSPQASTDALGGKARFTDASSSAVRSAYFPVLLGDLVLFRDGTDTALSSTAPWTWTTSDTMVVSVIYVAAS